VVATKDATVRFQIASKYSETGHMGRDEKYTTYILELTKDQNGNHDAVLVREYEERDFEERRATVREERRFAISGTALAELIMANGKEIVAAG